MSRIALAMVWLLSMAALAEAQQPCNPVIDGTYCATQMPRRPDLSAPAGGFRPGDSGGSSISSSSYGQPATLGGITFSGGDGPRCFGLLRGINCNLAK